MIERVSECHKTAYEAHGYDVISMSKKRANEGNFQANLEKYKSDALGQSLLQFYAEWG